MTALQFILASSFQSNFPQCLSAHNNCLAAATCDFFHSVPKRCYNIKCGISRDWHNHNTAQTRWLCHHATLPFISLLPRSLLLLFLLPVPSRTLWRQLRRCCCAAVCAAQSASAV